ncbi:MAG: hypothetical protein BJ554DRAFT_4837 [Olpidium bornovanus]|uniref:Uncharacterized protein n=1 Tax=Olpidium bornovanus TaxID=278681 RepID=A0A8H8DE69_9FUNG|nr:MAG: hypothetical protein BJ554DRAFT_4837 [Olpidium bornovanus]
MCCDRQKEHLGIHNPLRHGCNRLVQWTPNLCRALQYRS